MEPGAACTLPVPISCYALCDFKPRTEKDALHELQLEAGQEVQLLGLHEGGWGFASCQYESGYVVRGYVSLYMLDPARYGAELAALLESGALLASDLQKHGIPEQLVSCYDLPDDEKAELQAPAYDPNKVLPGTSSGAPPSSSDGAPPSAADLQQQQQQQHAGKTSRTSASAIGRAIAGRLRPGRTNTASGGAGSQTAPSEEQDGEKCLLM